MSDGMVYLTLTAWAVLGVVGVVGLVLAGYGIGRAEDRWRRTRDARLIQAQRDIIARQHRAAAAVGVPVEELERIAHELAVQEQEQEPLPAPPRGRHAAGREVHGG